MVISSEHSPRLLTESQKGDLQGRPKGADMRSGLRLYMAQGIPTLFRRDGAGSDEVNADTWLYIPGEILASMRQSLVVQGCNTEFNHVAKDGFEGDNQTLYPVLLAGQVRAVITVTPESSFDPDPKTAEIILQAIGSRLADESERDAPDLIRTFLARLFARDRGFDDFQKATLELMTDLWPGSLGAVYYEENRVWQMRLAVGDIRQADHLHGTLTESVTQSYGEAIRRGQFLMPADMMPDYPVIMDCPPNYLFVHPGILSDQSEYIVVLVIPGDIGLVQVTAIRRIAQLAGNLHESQFSTASEVIGLYGRLAGLHSAEGNWASILEDTFRVVHRQVGLSRLVLASDEESCTVVIRGEDGEPSVRAESRSPIPTGVMARLEEQQPLLVPDVPRDPAASEEPETDGVSSQMLYRLEFSPGRSGYVAFGSPLVGNHLSKHRGVLDAVVSFLSLCLGLKDWSRRRDAMTVEPSPEVYASVAVANDRLNTVAKLAGGYFHDLMEHLSVVVGQNEIIQSAMDDGAIETVLGGSAKVQQAADRIAKYLDSLRTLCLVSTEQLERPVSCGQLLMGLPNIVHGHARQIKDSKNVSLSIRTSLPEGFDFQTTYGELYDCLLPLVLGLMDEAICSGTLEVSATNESDGAQIQFEFPVGLIGHTGLGEMLERIYSHRKIELHDDNAGVVHLGASQLTFDVPWSTVYRVVIRLNGSHGGAVVTTSDSSSALRPKGCES